MKAILQKLALYPDKIDTKSLFISYILVNIVFLFHTINFMWGNHDVGFIKDKLALSSGLFEGRFTQFILPFLLTDSQILPVITNLLGLAFLTLGLWLLAKYWNIPKSVLTYTLFIVFFITEPYTLSWLYFTFITLSCLSWVFFAVLGLYLSSHICHSTHKTALFLIATLCFYLPLGGYPPIINTIFVCLGAKITLSYIFEKKSLKELFKTHIYSLLAVIIAAITLKITLSIINPNSVYNLTLTPFNEMGTKFILTVGYTLKQFTLSLPFMEKGYKILLLIMVLTSFATALLQINSIKRYLISLIFICATLWASSLTTFLVIPPTQYVARIDFYGLAFIYVFALAVLFTSKPPLAKSIGIIFMLILIPFNATNDARALKIWYQGFTAEIKILDDVLDRIENHPQFNPSLTGTKINEPSHQYRFYQAGDITLRPAYYQEHFEQNEPFLLSLPYLATWQGSNMAEFYSPFNYIDRKMPILPTDITPEVRDFILNEAHPYPHQNSIFINNDIIILIYNQYGLDELKEKIRLLYSEDRR